MSPAPPRTRRRGRTRVHPRRSSPFLALLTTAILFFAGGTLLFGGFVGASDEAGEAYLSKVSSEVGVKTLPSGLRYKVLKDGSGKFHPTLDSPCLCHYAGSLIDGTEFDSSYTRQEPATFAPNQVIKGWTEALQLMVEGDIWELYAPSDLAYGARGSPPDIPADSVLVFKIKLIEIQGGTILAITCDPATLDGCDDQMAAYVEKATAKYSGDVDLIDDEITRLTKMQKKGGMNSNLKDWINVRMYLLEKIVGPIREKEEL